MRTRKVPRGARHLRTYMELESYLLHFVRGLYPFLWIVGRPGIQKTCSLQAAVRGRPCYYRKAGQLRPLQFYLDLYSHRGQPVLLDDAEHLLDETVGAKLISALGETLPGKLISYGSTTRALGDVPTSFSTNSPLCVLTNKVTAHEDILSRAVILYFNPTNLEVHQAVARWFWDQEIHDWFGRHLTRLPSLDMRWYVHASNDKLAQRDWQQIILKTQVPARVCFVVQDLEHDPAYPTREDKARRFGEVIGKGNGGSRSTYHRILDRLRAGQLLEVEPLSPIRLRRTRPPGTLSVMELDSLEVPFPDQPEEDTSPLDVPTREQFAQPIQGQGGTRTTPQPMVLDDSLPWEGRASQDDDDEGK
jgi:hypothetical protein